MLSAPFLLLVAALGLSLATIFLSQRPTAQALFSAVVAAAVGASLLSADLLAFLELPMVGVTWGMPGRIAAAHLPVLAAWWFGLAALGPIARWSGKPGPFFLPLAWLVAAVWQIALVGDPPITALVAGVVALALAAPLLSEGRGQGVLLYAVLALTLVLLANWQNQMSIAAPTTLAHALATTLALGISCMLLSGAFPFHVWSPALQPSASPSGVALLALVLQPAALLMTEILTQDLGLARTPLGLAGLRLAGVLSLAAAAAMSFGERRLERLLSHALILDVGATLLAIGRGGAPDPALFGAMLGVRVLGVAAWSSGLATLRAGGASTTLPLTGSGLRLPLATLAYLVGPLTIAGYPLLAGFPWRWMLMLEVGLRDPAAALALLAALAGIGFATFRSLTDLITPTGEGSTLRFGDRGWPALANLIVVTLILLSAAFPQTWTRFLGSGG